MTLWQMKKGLNLWSAAWPDSEGAPDWDALVRLVRGIGYDGVEFIFDEGKLNPRGISKARRKNYVERAQAEGLDIPSVATGAFWQRNLASPVAGERERAIEFGRLGLDLASDLGAHVLLVVPAVNLPEFRYQDMWDASISSIRSMARHAEDVGVTIGVENVWNKFLYSPIEFRRFIESVGSDGVRAYLDVGNILELGHPAQWIRELKGLIACVHVKDFDTSVGGPSGFRHIGKGSMDWAGTMRELKSAGYDYYLNVECFPSFEPGVTSRTFAEAIRYAEYNSKALDLILAGSS